MNLFGNRATSAKPPAHGHTHDDTSLRTDKNGMFTIEINHSGYWYLRTIDMVESDDTQHSKNRKPGILQFICSSSSGTWQLIFVNF